MLSKLGLMPFTWSTEPGRGQPRPGWRGGGTPGPGCDDLGGRQDAEGAPRHIVGTQQELAFPSLPPDASGPLPPQISLSCEGAVQLEDLQDPFQPKRLSSLG